MVTKATRDVLNLKVRSVEDIVVDGSTGSRIDNVPIGTVRPNVGYFTNLYADTLKLTNPLQYDIVHDGSLAGKGTSSSPLRVNQIYHDSTLSGDGTSSNPLRVIGSGGANALSMEFSSSRVLTVNVDGVSDSVTIPGGTGSVSNVDTSFNASTRALTVAVDGKSDSVTIPATSGDIVGSGSYSVDRGTTNSNELRVLFSEEIETDIPVSAWSGAQYPYGAIAGLNGGVTATPSDASNNIVFWGFTTTVIPLTRWSGPHRLWLKVDFWGRNVSHVKGAVTWKVYEIV